MRIGSNGYNLINSIYTQQGAGGRMMTQPGKDPMQGGSAGSGWQKGTAVIDPDSKVSVRKQMQDQIRNLFEKEQSKGQNFALENNTDAVTGTDKEDEKDDKLLNSGKIYNFKEISNKIMRAKTPLSAGQAVIAAKRKISQIKREIARGDGDSDDLQLALTHAKKMEVVAQRKKNNLQLEELIQNTGKRDEALKEQKESASMSVEEYERIKEELMDKQLKEIEDSAKEASEELSEEMTEKAMEEMSERMTEELTEDMAELEKSMLEETSEMLDVMELVDPHMSEDELNKLKLKHRLAENKALMKADMDYLKGSFKNTGTIPGMPAGQAAFSMAAGAVAAGPAVSAPEPVSAPVSVDVST